MSYEYVKKRTLINFTNSYNSKKYICVHYTGNVTDTAADNASYFYCVNRGASAHDFVDDTQVVNVVPYDKVAWAVGVNYPRDDHKNLFGKVNNFNTISIEMCSRSGKITEATFDNTVTLVRWLMKRYGIPASNVYRHWDACSKNCPGWNGWGSGYKNDSIWQRFKAEIAVPEDVGWKMDETGWWYKNADGSYPRDKWVKLDAWYRFNDKGYALEDEWFYGDGYCYYLGSDCRMKTGWFFDNRDKEWYYLRPLSYSSKAPEGAMLTGWQYIDGLWYYLNKDKSTGHPIGSAATGLQEIDGNTYYLHPRTTEKYVGCSMAVGWVYTNGAWYYFNEDYNCQERGSMLKAHWVLYKGEKYYLKDDGKMAHDETLTITGDKCKFGPTGILESKE